MNSNNMCTLCIICEQYVFVLPTLVVARSRESEREREGKKLEAAKRKKKLNGNEASIVWPLCPRVISTHPTSVENSLESLVIFRANKENLFIPRNTKMVEKQKFIILSVIAISFVFVEHISCRY